MRCTWMGRDRQDFANLAAAPGLFPGHFLRHRAANRSWECEGRSLKITGDFLRHFSLDNNSGFMTLIVNSSCLKGKHVHSSNVVMITYHGLKMSISQLALVCTNTTRRCF